MTFFGSTFSSSVARNAAVAAVASVALATSVSPGFAQSGPFSTFGGAWTGAGTVELADGSKERIRCRATYNVGNAGNSLKQSLRCASDSYRFELATDVTAQGNTVSGRWSEASRNLNGDLQGKVSGGQITVFVTANAFAGNLSVITRGNRQTVTLDSKSDLRGVAITMTRS